MMAGPKVFISPPERRPRLGGIKSVIGDFATAPHIAAAEALQWISDGCEFPKAAPGLCYPPNPVTGDKTFVGIDDGTGPIFALYQGVQCYLDNDADYDTRAAELLSQGEDRGVEEVLWEYVMSTGGTGPAQTSWVGAIGQMDELADTLYLGQPVIMLSRAAAVQARAAKAIFGDEESGRLWTANGTPVIASAAAPDNVAAVLGWPSVYASEVVTVRTVVPIVNQEMALAERVYGIAIDCNYAHHYAVNVTAGQQNPDPDPGTPLVMTLGSIPSSPIPDGTDVTAVVQTNQPVTDPIEVWYSLNGGPTTLAGEATQVDTLEFVFNADESITVTGDSVEVWATSLWEGNPVESNHITIEVI